MLPVSDNPLPSDEELRRSLAAGQDYAVARLFHAHDTPRPRVLWEPQLPDMADPRHREFREFCDQSASAGDLPALAGFLDALPEHLRDATILMVIGPEGQLCYEHFGKAVTAQYGAHLTGPMSGQMASHIERFYQVVFDVAKEQRWPVLTEHQPPLHVFVQAWHRYVTPLTDAAGEVCAFAVLNVAFNPLRAGLDAVHEPVFVLDGEQAILYANPPARLLMGKGNGRPWGGEFFAETGVALPEDLAPAEKLLGKRMVEVRRSFVLRDTLLTEAVISISAVMHRIWPCYVVIVRPES